MLHMKRTFELTFKGSLTDFLTIARQFAQSRGYVADKNLLWNLSVEPHDSLADVHAEFIHFCFDPIVRIPTGQKPIEIDLDTVLERRPKQGNEDLVLRIIKIWMDEHGNCKWVYAKVFGYQLNNITCIDVYSKIKDDCEEDNAEIEHWPIIEPIWMELVNELNQSWAVGNEVDQQLEHQDRKLVEPLTGNFLLTLSPDLQCWYYIILQSEYERAHHARTYTHFCQQNGLNFETYKRNKIKLKKEVAFNIIEWVPNKKPEGAHEKVIQAIKKKRESRWEDPPNIHL